LLIDTTLLGAIKAKMKVVILIILSSIILCLSIYAQEFKWVRAEFPIQNPKGTAKYDEYHLEDWDFDMSADLLMLKELEQATTIKPEHKVFTVKLENLDEMVKYPLIFMHASDYAIFSDNAVKNMREYLNRGGMIFADDCNAGPEGDRFWRSVKLIFESKVFPGKKFVEIPEDHEIFHCHFEMPLGMPQIVGVSHPFLGLMDDKGRIMVFLTSADLHCGWSQRQNFPPLKRRQGIKMTINIIVYALTH
jgi:hypothetical protein